jgi:hypothetical protein
MMRFGRLVSAAFSVAAVDARHAPVQITTDTPAYCATLQTRLHEREKHQGLPARARALTRAGESLCENGDISGGIIALRKAMILSLHAAPERMTGH